VPFQFQDLSDTSRAVNRTVVSSNESPLCNCRDRHSGGRVMAARKSFDPQFSGQVSVAQWWSELVTVPKGSKMFEVTLQWAGAGDALDLHLVSPSGKHYGWYADTTGYSGSQTNPQEFHLPKPEAGTWRISVEGVRGSGLIEFGVATTGKKQSPQLVAASAGQ
jgi:hypothetical protein